MNVLPKLQATVQCIRLYLWLYKYLSIRNLEILVLMCLYDVFIWTDVFIWCVYTDCDGELEGADNGGIDFGL